MNAAVAKKGVGLLFNATKSRISSISSGVNKARKAYANKHEADVLSELREKGLSPSDLIFQAFQRLYFLYMAGYKHELVAAAQMAGKRLTDPTKTSVPLDVVVILGLSLCNECSKYGDFEKGKFYQNMQDFLTKSNGLRICTHKKGECSLKCTALCPNDQFKWVQTPVWHTWEEEK